MKQLLWLSRLGVFNRSIFKTSHLPRIWNSSCVDNVLQHIIISSSQCWTIPFQVLSPSPIPFVSPSLKMSSNPSKLYAYYVRCIYHYHTIFFSSEVYFCRFNRFRVVCSTLMNYISFKYRTWKVCKCWWRGTNVTKVLLHIVIA
jgi:hypothetical protein